MTCIVGLKSGDLVYLGGDSAGVAGLDLHSRTDPKVFTKVDPNGQRWAFGYTSSFRMGQLVRFNLELPDVATPPPSKRLEFMSTRFVDKLRECYKAGGFATRLNEAEAAGIMLVGFMGELYYVGGDYQVGTLGHEFAAVGCGDHLALGALWATKGKKMEPLDRLELALSAAYEFSAGVRPPFRFVSTVMNSARAAQARRVKP